MRQYLLANLAERNTSTYLSILKEKYGEIHVLFLIRLFLSLGLENNKGSTVFSLSIFSFFSTLTPKQS
jgi:hypothetical protein